MCSTRNFESPWNSWCSHWAGLPSKGIAKTLISDQRVQFKSIIDRPRSANGVFPAHKCDRWAEIKFPSHERSAFAKSPGGGGGRKERENLGALVRALPVFRFFSSSSARSYTRRTVIDLARAERGGGKPTRLCANENYVRLSHRWEDESFGWWRIVVQRKGSSLSSSG